MARPEGFEPPTPWFVARYSIQLSYGRSEKHCCVRAAITASQLLFRASRSASIPIRASDCSVATSRATLSREEQLACTSYCFPAANVDLPDLSRPFPVGKLDGGSDACDAGRVRRLHHAMLAASTLRRSARTAASVGAAAWPDRWVCRQPESRNAASRDRFRCVPSRQSPALA